MGTIDLDPMSNSLANETIRATNIYTKKDDGLSKEWFGNVWLNPAFSLSSLAIPKLINSYEKGGVIQAVLLVKSDVSTQKYKLLYPYPFCELDKRVKFESLNTNQGSPFPVVMFYFGKNFYKWSKVMGKHGKVHIGHDLFTRLAMRCNLEDLKSLGIVERGE